ncbi:MAG TPA: molybdopterin cofactor-binding domain-containing protein, partial [Methylovirgula sp.]
MLMEHLASLEQNPESRAEDGLTRRTFLRASAAAGGGFLLSISLPFSTPGAIAAEAAEFSPNAFVRIGRDNRVTFIMPQVEMGQGTYTSMSMLIAEELAIDLDQIDVAAAPANDQLYGNPLIGFQVTGGSTSVRGFFTPLREAGAVARTMLIAAAAQRWQVDPATCRAEKGAVIDAKGNRRLSYGELADEAAKQPMPGKVALKPAKDFTVIGTPAPRVDSPGKVNGSAQYGIDAKVPGMKIATVA